MKPVRIRKYPEAEAPRSGGRETTKPAGTWLPLRRILCPVDQAPVRQQSSETAGRVPSPDPRTPAPGPSACSGPTEAACRALKTAEELAGVFCGELLLLHVIAPTPVAVPPLDATLVPPFDVASYEADLRDAYRGSLERLRKERLDHKLTVHVRVVTGDPATEIVRHAKEDKCDLIVLPTHGRTGLSHVFFGSVAEKVVRHAECPVLTLH
jgi:nucleotide-binding universal stress UspA family protein